MQGWTRLGVLYCYTILYGWYYSFKVFEDNLHSHFRIRGTLRTFLWGQKPLLIINSGSRKRGREGEKEWKEKRREERREKDREEGSKKRIKVDKQRKRLNGRRWR